MTCFIAVLLPGKSHGQRSLVGCSPRGHEESDTTERLHFHFLLSCIGEGNGNSLQCSCLENPRDGGSLVGCCLGVLQSWTQLKRLSSSSSFIAIFSFFKDFLMWTIFTIFIEFVTILLLFYVLVFWSRGMWDLSSPTRDQTHTPCFGRWSFSPLNHQASPCNLLFITMIWNQTFNISEICLYKNKRKPRTSQDYSNCQ